MASTLRFDNWENTLGVPYGTVLQVKTVRTEARNTYSAPNSGDGTTITDLNLTITPNFSNSLLIVQWMLNGEMDHDAVILVHKNGSLITTANEAGYNATAGNSRWSGFVPSKYDNDVSSTPENWFIQYFSTAASTSSMTFAPAVRASSATAKTFYLNRAVASAGQDGQEVSVSTGTIWEIAQ
jgi:hypothetical protein